MPTTSAILIIIPKIRGAFQLFDMVMISAPPNHYKQHKGKEGQIVAVPTTSTYEYFTVQLPKTTSKIDTVKVKSEHMTKVII